MRTLFVPVTIILTILCLSLPVYGGGFSIYEQGTTATGMAGAFTAKADDVTALFYNPAGISQLEGTHISVGVSLIPPETELRDPWGNTWETDQQNFLVPNIYISHELNDLIDLGISVTTPYGLGMDWSENEDFVYRYLVKDVTLQSTYIAPTIAFSLNDNWSIAGGPIYAMSEVEYVAAVDMSDISAGLSAALGTTITLDDSQMTLDADNEDGDWGFALSLHGQMDRLHVGVAYRSAVECVYSGDADFDIPASMYGADIDALVRTFLPNTSGGSKIEMPASVQVGIGFDLTDKLYAEADVLWQGWSSYESLDIDFGDPSIPDVSQRKDWDDAMSYRFGLYYQATEELSVFGGYYFDETPIPDETLDPIMPCADRNSIQIGAGYDFGNLKIEAAFMELMADERETTSNYRGINGEYETTTHILTAQLSYSF